MGVWFHFFIDFCMLFSIAPQNMVFGIFYLFILDFFFFIVSPCIIIAFVAKDVLVFVQCKVDP